MKITRIIPILAATALLTGCNLSNGQALKPSKYKNESTCAELYEKYEEGLNKVGVPQGSDPADFSYKGTSQYIVKNELKNGKTQKNLMALTETINAAAEFDKDSMVGHTNIKATMKYDIKQGYGAMKYVMNASAKNESYGQETVKGTGYELTVAKLVDGKYSKSESSERNFYSGFFANVASISMLSMLMPISPTGYETMSDADKASYKFYVDGNVYTTVYHVDLEDKDETAEATGTEEYILQYKVNEGKLDFFVSITDKFETTYLKNYSDYLAGETLVQSTQMVGKGTLTFKDIDLDMKDVSKLSLSTSAYNANAMFNVDLGL